MLNVQTNFATNQPSFRGHWSTLSKNNTELLEKLNDVFIKNQGTKKITKDIMDRDAIVVKGFSVVKTTINNCICFILKPHNAEGKLFQKEKLAFLDKVNNEFVATTIPHNDLSAVENIISNNINKVLDKFI